MKFGISPLVFFIFALSAMCRLLPQTLIIYFTAVLHELAHAGAAALLGEKVEELKVLPYGCSIKISESSALNEILICASGPIFNFILFTISPDVFFKQVNLLMMILNLIPIHPLDGGRILRAAISMRLSEAKSYRFTRKVGFVLLIFLILATLILLIFYKSPSLILMCAFLIPGAFSNDDEEYIHISRSILAENKKHLPPKYVKVPVTMPVYKLFKYITSSRHCIFIITDAENNILGQITETEIIKTLAKYPCSSSQNLKYLLKKHEL